MCCAFCLFSISFLAADLKFDQCDSEEAMIRNDVEWTEDESTRL